MGIIDDIDKSCQVVQQATNIKVEIVLGLGPHYRAVRHSAVRKKQGLFSPTERSYYLIMRLSQFPMCLLHRLRYNSRAGMQAGRIMADIYGVSKFGPIRNV